MYKSYKASRSHEVMKIGDDVPDKVMAKSLEIINCDIHRGKVLDYYCADCKKIVCVSCLYESHSTHDCKDVNTLEKEFRKSIASSAKMIATLSDELLAKKLKSEGREQFLDQVAAIESAILRRSLKLTEMIDTHTKDLLRSLDVMKNQHLKDIQIEKDKLDRRLTVLQRFSRYCDELITKGSASDVCWSKEDIFLRAEELEEDHETYIMQPRVSFNVSFKPTNFEDLLKTSNGNIIGDLRGNVIHLEDDTVVFGESDDSVCKCKIKLRSQRVMISFFERIPFEVSVDHTGAIYDNKLFITGAGNLSDEIWKYCSLSGWKKCGSLVEGREGHCSVFIGEKLYVCGGFNEDFILMDSVESYNALTEESKVVGQLRIGSLSPVSLAYNGAIYIFGGTDKDEMFLDCVQVFNPVGNTCTLLSTPIPRPVFCQRAVLWKTCAILQVQDGFFLFDLEKKTWQEREQFKLDPYTMQFGMALVNDRIFIMGGAYKVADTQGNTEQKFKSIVKYIRVSSIMNNEEAKWRIIGHLPRPMGVIATANLSQVKSSN